MEFVKKTSRIVNYEIYNGVKNSIVVNVLVLIFLIGLQFSDITLKISSNNFALIWISINTYFIFWLFFKDSSKYILTFGTLTDKRKYLLLIAVSLTLNFHCFLFIYIQLIVSMKASHLHALIILAAQAIFSIALGTFGGMLNKKHLGLIMIAILGICNFVVYNPLIYDGSVHIFSISELLFTVNVINTSNLLFLAAYSLFFISMSYIMIKTKKRVRQVFLAVLVFCIGIISILYRDVYKYNNIRLQKMQILDNASNLTEYRGLPLAKVNDISFIASLFEQEFQRIDPGINLTKISVDKVYLPKLVWNIKKKVPQAVAIKDDVLYINVLSETMVYFDMPDYLRNFMEEMQIEFVTNTDNYSLSRFTRHLVEGYSIGILDTVHMEFNRRYLKEESGYYIDEVFTAPSNQFNYVKKIGLIIFVGYPKHFKMVYSTAVENDPKTDEEFIELLKTNHKEIYDDVRVQYIIESAFN